MLPRSLDEIDEALLSSVCTEHWPESQTLDFKRQLPKVDAHGRHELLKDICALANVDGGDVIYGIAERNGRADSLIPIVGVTADAVRRRLIQILDAGIEPRVNGIAMREVLFAGGGFAWIIRVPASFNSPHRYRQEQCFRFVMRLGTLTSDMSYDQLRDAFDRSATIAERARTFRKQRLEGVATGATGRPLRAGPKCVVHLIPLAALAGKLPVDVGHLYNNYQEFMFPDWGGATRSFNLDGLVVYPGDRTADLAYTQIFRSGAFEASRFAGVLNVEDDQDRNSISAGVMSEFVREALQKFLSAAVRWNFSGPAIAGVALLGLENHRFLYQPPGQLTVRKRADRPNLVLPEVLIEQLAAVVDPDTIVKPVLDTLWQSFDMERCAYYDARGRWARH